MQRSIFSICAAVMLCVSNAPADALTLADLIGRYAYVENAVCLNATSGFNTLQQAMGTASTETVATFRRKIRFLSLRTIAPRKTKPPGGDRRLEIV
jgi:hypothetical protein